MNKKTSNSNRVIYFDILNIFACFAVILLHHNGIVHNFSNTLAWKESLVIECGFYWAVPVFLMLSGANLMNYRSKYNTVTFFQKRILRTVIPWLLWSFLTLLWKCKTGKFTLESHSVKYIFDLIVNNRIMPIYWFFSALFACYLAIPVFSLLLERKKILWYIVLLNFIFASCLPLLNMWFGISWGLDIPVVGSLIIYILLGHLISAQEFSPGMRIIIYILGIGGFLFRFIYTYIFSMQKGETDTTIKGYVMFHAVFLSVAVFEAAKNVPWNRLLPDRFLSKLSVISSCSFGIYLIHPVIMHYEKLFFHMSVSQHIWRFGFVFCTYLISFFIIYVIKLIPIIGRYLC